MNFYAPEPRLFITRLLLLTMPVLFVATPGFAATITVPAGANIQSYVNANPAGTTYQLSAGTYSRQTVRPKSGDTFRGASGLRTILDGRGGTSERHAFTARSGIINVTIDGLVIKNYVDNSNPNMHRGVLYVATPNSNPGWTLKNSDIGPNTGTGVGVFGGMNVYNNKIHDNSLVGIKGFPKARDIIINNNEIYNNNTDHNQTYGTTAFAGGTKFYDVSWITITNNKIYGNYSFGLWFDTDWNHVTITGNEVFGNLRDFDHTNQASIGILLELSLPGGTYTDNVVANNYVHDEDVGMLISTASDLDIHHNAFSGNRVATIRAFEEPRGVAPNSITYQEQHVHIHDNWFAYSRGVNSQRDAGSGFRWYNQDNTYRNNIYYIQCGPGDFAYQGGYYTDSNGRVMNYTAWRNLPSNPDRTSTFNCGQTTLPPGVGPRGEYVATR